MNQRTSKLLRKVWRITNWSKKGLKQIWNTTAKKRRGVLRRALQKQVNEFENRGGKL